MTKFFGTDGIRGESDLFSPSFVSKILNGIFEKISETKKNEDITVLVGGDTRESTKKIIEYVYSYCNYCNVKFINAGILPTPALSCLVKKSKADVGICITASHNPFYDNGIKIFSSSGEKIDEEFELFIENILNGPNEETNYPLLGYPLYDKDVIIPYVNHVINYIDINQSDLKIGVDCANGASSNIAKIIFEKLGLNVKMTNDNKNYGRGINENCGSTHIATIKKFVIDNSLDLGIAYDGDADRALLVDNEGNLVDGDKMVVIIANYLKSIGELRNNAFVVTEVTNPGILEYANAYKMKAYVVPVGDINVKNKVTKENLSVGGEQVGHVLLPNQDSDDGILTSLFMIMILIKTKKTLKKLADEIILFPQTSSNIEANSEEKAFLEKDIIYNNIIKKYKKIITKNGGKISIRPSGTQDLIRVTIWSKEKEKIEEWSKAISREIRNRLSTVNNS